MNITIDLGATWIHGTVENPIFEFALQHSLLPEQPTTTESQTDRTRTEFLLMNGIRLPEGSVNQVMQLYGDCFSKAESYFDQSPLSEDQNFEEMIREKFRNTICSKDTCQNHDAENAILENQLKYESSVSGCNSMRDVSCQQFGSYHELEGPDYVFNHGYSSVIQKLSENLPAECIHLNSVVKCIDSSAVEKPVESSDPTQNSIKVTLEDGTCQYFDHVIYTGSLGCLKTSENLFIPKLNALKTEAVGRLGFGTVAKIFLCFLPNEIELFWPEGVHEVRLCYMHDTYENPRKWFEKIFGFYVEHESSKGSILSGELRCSSCSSCYFLSSR